MKISLAGAPLGGSCDQISAGHSIQQISFYVEASSTKSYIFAWCRCCRDRESKCENQNARSTVVRIFIGSVYIVRSEMISRPIVTIERKWFFNYRFENTSGTALIVFAWKIVKECVIPRCSILSFQRCRSFVHICFQRHSQNYHTVDSSEHCACECVCVRARTEKCKQNFV